MFSILRFRQGCLYFHFYSNVWVSLVLLKGFILSALEGAIITRQRGRQCWKEIAQHNFPPPFPNVSLFRMTWINFRPYCPLHFHPEEPRGREKTLTKNLRRDYAGRNIAHLDPWLPRSLSLVVWIQWSLDSGEGGTADVSSSHLISRSAALW